MHNTHATHRQIRNDFKTQNKYKTYKHHNFNFLFFPSFPFFFLLTISFFHSLMKAIWPYSSNLIYFIPISDGDCVQIAARIKNKYNMNQALIWPFRPSLAAKFQFLSLAIGLYIDHSKLMMRRRRFHAHSLSLCECR